MSFVKKVKLRRFRILALFLFVMLQAFGACAEPTAAISLRVL